MAYNTIDNVRRWLAADYVVISNMVERIKNSYCFVAVSAEATRYVFFFKLEISDTNGNKMIAVINVLAEVERDLAAA